MARRSEARLELAPPSLASARLCVAIAAQRDARAPLREALDLALERGAAPLARAAQDELVASGAQPRRLRSSGRDALTPTEQRVAAMAGGG